MQGHQVEIERSTPWTVLTSLDGLFCLLLLTTSLFVYLANGRAMTSRDTFVHSLLALNWLQHHTLHLDALRSSFAGQPLPWFLVEAPNGHLTSPYPIGTAIVTFPFYAIATLVLKLGNLLQTGQFDLPAPLADLTSPDFEIHRRQLQKVVAAIATALSVVLFYLSLRIQFHLGPAVLTSFIFAFATSTWTISAQGVWQHTALNLVMVALILGLLKANHTTGPPQTRLLLVAGFLCGLLPSIRPVALVYFLAIVLYVGLTHRGKFPYFLAGLSSILFYLVWTIYSFGFSFNHLWMGGYTFILQEDNSYQWSLFTAGESLAGLLLSPSRGLLIYSPVLLFALPGCMTVLRDRHTPDNRLIGAITLAGIGIGLQYGLFQAWHANLTYGPRFFVDILPIACYLIAWFLSWDLDRLARLVSWSVLSLFFTALTASMLIQGIGAFGNYNSWELAPYRYQSRLWDWQDTEITRTASSIFYRAFPPIRHPQVYLQNLDGHIQSITTLEGRPLPAPLRRRPSQLLWVRVRVRNTGLARWFGYRTGMEQGETRIRATFLPQEGQPTPQTPPQTNQLFIEGNPASGQIAEAVGTLAFPAQPGNYILKLDLFVQGVGPFQGNSRRSPYTMEVRVNPRRPPASAAPPVP